MRTVGRAVYLFAAYDGGFPLALLCVLLGAAAGHYWFGRWP